MPSRRSAFRIAALVCASGLPLFAGCNGARSPGLAAVPDLDLTAAPDAAAANAGFPLPCGPGRAWLATLAQHEFDARLELRDAAGALVTTVAGPARAAGLELLFHEPAAVAATAAPGRAFAPRLRVIANEPPPRSARFTLQVRCFDAPPTRDVAAALRGMTSANDPANRGDAARRDAAARLYESAGTALRRDDAPALAAQAGLQLAALHYYEREDWPAALAAARAVAATPAAAVAPKLRAAARLIEGAASMELARGGQSASTAAAASAPADAWNTARSALQDAADLFQRDGAPLAAAQVKVYLAGLHYERGELDAAVADYESAARALHAEGALADEARIASNLAAVRFDRGDYVGAESAYEALLAANRDASPAQRAALLQNLAASRSAIGDTERSLVAYRESLELGTQLGDDDVVARALAGLGAAHARLGHPDLALTYTRDAVALRRRQGRSDALARALAQLGDVHRVRRERAAASAAYGEAVATLGPAAAPALRARLLLALGQDQLDAADPARAEATFSAALKLVETVSHGPVAPLLLARAQARRLNGALDPAAADIRRAIALATAGVDVESQIGAQVEAARLALARDDRAGALRAADAAVAAIERLPAGAANPDNRQTLRARLRDAYELRVGLLADAARESPSGSTRAHSGALAALRAAAARDLVSPAATRTAASAATSPTQDQIYATLAARRHRLETLAERSSTPSPTMLALEREIALLRTRLATADLGDATATPTDRAARRNDAAARRAATPARAALAARTLPMTDDTVVLAYSLGTRGSWRWILSARELRLDPLPDRATLEAAVDRALRELRGIRAPLAGAARAHEVAALERLLLPADLVGDRAPRWRVVVDGALGAVPWPLLAQRRSARAVSLLPSAAALFAAASDASATPAPVAAATPATAASRAASAPTATAKPLRLALFGDPVFDADDPRLPAPPGAARPTTPFDDLAGLEPQRLPRLAGTAREIAALARLDGAAVVVQATGFAATREALSRLPSAGVDVLHLATHAVIDPELPELAALVLSRVDAHGAALDGSLRARDIQRLPVPPLVVLSACDAAAEPGGTADGRMNLVRAFLAAGANQVVGSLWEVPDASTVELMSAFYDGLLRDRLEPEFALAQAQARLAADRRWRAPFYWAGFVLTRSTP